MKFFRYKICFQKYVILQKEYYSYIKNNKLNAIYQSNAVIFFKNGLFHNDKNKAITEHDQAEGFYLNGKVYGNENTFTKQSWRKFTKLQTFL